jgi:predicted regulator of Ras-like GTPase activity (Roadblock/LC7/MglB family)
MDQLSGSTELNSLLQEINAEGEFPISVLTDPQGLSIAWAASNGMDPERQSAVVAFIQKAAVQVGTQLGMGETDEISFYDVNGQHLVCRPFQVNQDHLILAVIVPGRDHSYRRATNHAMREIRRIWKTFWE